MKDEKNEQKTETLALLPKISKEELQTLKQAIEPTATDTEILMYLAIAKSLNLNPFMEMNLIKSKSDNKWRPYLNKTGYYKKAQEKGILILQPEIEECVNPVTKEPDLKVIANFMINNQKLSYYIYASEYTTLKERSNWKNFPVSMLWARAEVVGLRRLLHLPLYSVEEAELVNAKVYDSPLPTYELPEKTAEKVLPRIKNDYKKEEILSEEQNENAIEEEKEEKIEEENKVVQQENVKEVQDVAKTDKQMPQKQDIKRKYEKKNVKVEQREKEKEEEEEEEIPVKAENDMNVNNIDSSKKEWREILEQLSSVSTIEQLKRIKAQLVVKAFKLGVNYGQELNRVMRDIENRLAPSQETYDKLSREEIINMLKHIMKTKFGFNKPSIIDLFIDDDGTLIYSSEEEIKTDILREKLVELSNANNSR